MSNYKGRVKGSVNTDNKKLKEAITLFLENNVDEFQGWFDKIQTPATKIKLYSQLLPYSLPKLRTIEMIEEPKEKEELNLSLLTDKELETLYSLYEKAGNEPN